VPLHAGWTLPTVAIAMDSPEIAEVVALVRGAGGATIGAYRDPLGGRPLVLGVIALERSSTDSVPARSVAHPRQAPGAKIDETAAFLDPLIVVARRRWAAVDAERASSVSRGESPGPETDHSTDFAGRDPGLSHSRLTTEKAHNLRDRSLEVIRMARSPR